MPTPLTSIVAALADTVSTHPDEAPDNAALPSAVVRENIDTYVHDLTAPSGIESNTFEVDIVASTRLEAEILAREIRSVLTASGYRVRSIRGIHGSMYQTTRPNAIVRIIVTRHGPST